MTIAAFLEWELLQPWRHELVDGEPRAMTGARVAHDLVAGNVGSALRVRLRASGSSCIVFSPDIALIVPAGNVRRPDLTVHCPPFDDRATALEHPRLIVEVLSDSTQSIDQLIKMEEYRAIPGLDYILFIAPSIREVGVWALTADERWQHAVLRAADATIELPRLGVSLPLAEIYQQVVLRDVGGPRLVWPGEEPRP